MAPHSWVGIILIVLGLLRAGVLVAHEPLVGYGNSGDMHRTGACLGLYPAIDAPARYAPSPQAPLPHYRFEDPRPGCEPTAEVAWIAAVARAAKAIAPEADVFKLRWSGLGKLGLLALTALLLAAALRHHPRAALAHGLIFLVVLSDPAVTLWFNTLSPEFFLLWGAYAAIGGAAALALPDSSRVAWLPLIAGLIVLAGAKHTFAALPVLLAVIALPWLWHRWRPGAVTVVVTAFLAAATSALLLAPAAAPGVDGASSQPPRAMSATSTLARALPAMQNPLPADVGTLQGGSGVRAKDLPAWAYSPLERLATRVPVHIFAAVSLAVGLAGLIALLAAAVWARPWWGDPRPTLLLAMLLGATLLYAGLVTVLDVLSGGSARHYWIGLMATFAALTALIYACVALPLHWLESPRGSVRDVAAVAGAIAVIAIAVHFALQGARSWPLAVGAIEAPSPQWPSEGIALRGWALDPYGVERVDVSLGTLRLPARYGEAATLGLGSRYPGYPDARKAAFVLDVDAATLARATAPGTALPVTVTVTNRTGAATVIEERKLPPPP